MAMMLTRPEYSRPRPSQGQLTKANATGSIKAEAKATVPMPRPGHPTTQRLKIKDKVLGSSELLFFERVRN